MTHFPDFDVNMWVSPTCVPLHHILELWTGNLSSFESMLYLMTVQRILSDKWSRFQIKAWLV